MYTYILASSSCTSYSHQYKKKEKNNNATVEVHDRTRMDRSICMDSMVAMAASYYYDMII